MSTSTPYLSVDLAMVRARFAELRAALPGARVFYAVKANPAPEVVATLARAGSGFDVASAGELRQVLELGADPMEVCHANPVRTPDDVLEAARAGVRLFVTDSPEDLAVLAECAPGAQVLVRVAVDERGSATPFGGKFGCSPAEAATVLRLARERGLQPAGLSFHVGSQQVRPEAWGHAIAVAAAVSADAGSPHLPLLDLGGGFPVGYREEVPPLSRFADEIREAVRTHFPHDPPGLAVEPGRFLVAEAGVLHASVVRVSQRHDGRRWVYLDVGRYGGLAETEGEAIGYRLATAHDAEVPAVTAPAVTAPAVTAPAVTAPAVTAPAVTAPAVLAGPTCDGDDVLYRDVELPLALRAGDRVRFLAAGAYTASYSSVGFNGLPPLPVVCHDTGPQGSLDRPCADPGGRPDPDGRPNPGGRPFSGRHVLAELTGVDAALLDDEATVRSALVGALTAAGASVLHAAAHRFDPRGLTVLAMLSESHASVHTWPEHGSAFVDVFTCGKTADPELAAHLLARRLGAVDVHVRTVERGTPAAGEEPQRQVSEPLSHGLRRLWSVDQVLWEGRTAFQDVLIARTSHGVTLFCDDERQSSEGSELVYHEALLVPAMLLADRLERVLVIGSSEGVVSAMAVAAGAHRVDHVDIDAECVRLCARHLPYGYTEDDLAAAERGNGPVRMHYTDGWEFLRAATAADSTTATTASNASTAGRYDVVVIDLPDERPGDAHAQHNRLYGVDFLRAASAVLAPGGVLTGQVGCPTLWRNDTLRTSLARYREVFPTLVHYGSDEHEWSFLTGALERIVDPVSRMTGRLATLPYRPESIDADALRRGSVLPASLRRA